jgi:hypothetical protein
MHEEVLSQINNLAPTMEISLVYPRLHTVYIGPYESNELVSQVNVLSIPSLRTLVIDCPRNNTYNHSKHNIFGDQLTFASSPSSSVPPMSSSITSSIPLSCDYYHNLIHPGRPSG